MLAERHLNLQTSSNIFKKHSEDRSLTNGNDEMLMTWDDDLANLAQGLSDSCIWDHLNTKVSE